MPVHNNEALTLADLIPPTYALSALKVYNWGPFHGFHKTDIDPDGTAIIGPTGSGKTSLVDALMTLLCAQPRYNLASTGGHESDRDLMSYVRGVSGAGNKHDATAHITRPLKTVTALEAYFDNGANPVRIAALLWVDSSSKAMNDLKRAWIFSQSQDHELEHLLSLQQSSGLRGLKQYAREEAGLSVYDNKKAYLAQLRRFFEVGENAFTLLNRAAGLKQINSIDELFRELVLDDHSAFVRAAEVAAEFDDLASIHAELELARAQLKSLEPIAQEHETLNQQLRQLDQLQRLQAILPVWYAMHAHRLWTTKVDAVASLLESCTAQCETLAQQVSQAETQKNNLRDRYMQAGGGSIEQIEQHIKAESELLKRSQYSAGEYQRIAKALEMDATISREGLKKNQFTSKTLQTQHQDSLQKKQEAVYKYGAEHKNCQDRVRGLTEEKDKIAQNHSNIPSRYVDLQTELAQALGLGSQNIPFIAELVELKAEHMNWRGAIERAIGGQRLRLLVPAAKIKQALAWVNARHHGLHVRLLRVEDSYPAAKFLSDGFTRKLNFKEHPCREAMKHLLTRIDRHCLDTVEDLDRTPYAMTISGLLSGKAGHFDKHDQRPLEKDWCTGFDNKDRILTLQHELDTAEQALKASGARFEQSRNLCTQLENSYRLLDTMSKLDFHDMDVPGVSASLKTLKEKLNALQAPNSDTVTRKQQWESAEDELKSLRAQEKRLLQKEAVLTKEHSDALKNRVSAFKLAEAGLSDEELSLGNDNFKLDDIETLHTKQEESRNQLQDALENCAKHISDCKVNLARLMTSAQKIDAGALTETGTDMEDVPHYLEQLRLLREEALPEKQQRFLEYLNQSSDQGVTQLLMSIESEVEKIGEKIEEINHTMRQVDYQPGHYLRLDPQRVEHESLSTLKKAQQHLRYAATQDDEGSSHYQALQTLVELLRDACERKRARGAQALLDPRYRLQFSVSVIQRSSGDIIETRTGSQGGSGGEKEIIASYILTASLSYALCPDGSSSPLFGTVVLDEAFSRSSQAVAGRIIAALREFGLHPLFITPNKEITLLRKHTRSAVLIHNKNTRSSMTSLSWEVIEQQAQQRKAQKREITN